MGLGFEDLDVYQQARELRPRVFKLTDRLPGKERYVLSSQMSFGSARQRVNE